MKRVYRTIVCMLFMAMTSVAGQAQTGLKEVKAQFQKQLDDLRANYAKNLKEAHLRVVQTHYVTQRTDMHMVSLFLRDYLQVEAARFQQLHLDTVKANFKIDDQNFSDLLGRVNYQRFKSYLLQQQFERVSLVVHQLDRIKKIAAESCDANRMKWPKAYYNAQAYFPYRAISFNGDSSYKFNFDVLPSHIAGGVTLGIGTNPVTNETTYSMQQGGIVIQPSTPLTGNQKADVAIATTLTAAGAYAFVSGLGMSQLVGSLLGGLAGGAAFAVAALAWQGFKAFMAGVEHAQLVNDINGIVEQINQILRDGIPPERDCNDVVEAQCQELMIKDQTLNDFLLTVASQAAGLLGQTRASLDEFERNRTSFEKEVAKQYDVVAKDWLVLADSPEVAAKAEDEFRRARDENKALLNLQVELAQSSQILDSKSLKSWNENLVGQFQLEQKTQEALIVASKARDRMTGEFLQNAAQTVLQRLRSYPVEVMR